MTEKSKTAKPAKGGDLILLGTSEAEISSRKRRTRGEIAVKFLIALLGAWGLIGAFTSMFSLSVNMTLLYASSAFFLAIFSAVFYSPKAWKWALPCLFALFTVALWLFKIEVVCGYKIIANSVFSAINSNSKLNLLIFDLKEIENQAYCAAVFLLFTLFPICCALAASVVRRQNVIATFVVTFTFLELGLLWGLEPSVTSAVMLVACWCAVCAMKFASYTNRDVLSHKSRGAASVGATVLIITLLVAWFGITVFPPENYSHDMTIGKFSADFESLADRLTGRKRVRGGGVSDGRLGYIDKISYTRKVALEVEMVSRSDAVYLKGYIGSNYTGNSWEQLDESEYSKFARKHKAFPNDENSYLEMQNMPVNYQELDTQRLEKNNQNIFEKLLVRNLRANPKYAYVPYNADYKNPDITAYYDACAAPNEGKSEYAFTVSGTGIYDEKRVTEEFHPIDEVSFGSLEHFDVQKDFINLERQYRIFAHDVYTRLPEEGNERLLAEAKRIFENKSMSKAEIIETVRDYLKKCADYSLEAGRLPEGEDFVDWFLYENHKGSCSHFASSAVLLFRCAGIPARYVEGYIVTNDDFDMGEVIGEEDIIYKRGDKTEPSPQPKRRVQVRDTNAHAWPEIYIDGYGWIPMEVTPGYSALSINPYKYSQTASSSKLNVTKPTKTTETTEITTAEHTTRATTRATNELNNHVGGSTDGFQAKKLLTLLLMFLSAGGLFVAGVFVRHMLALSRRSRAMRSGKQGRVRFMYEQILLIFDFLGLKNEANLPPLEYAELLDSEHSAQLPEPFKPIAALILRAQFSTAGVTHKQEAQILGFLKSLSRKTCKALPLRKRLAFRYHKNLYWG